MFSFFFCAHFFRTNVTQNQLPGKLKGSAQKTWRDKTWNITADLNFSIFQLDKCPRKTYCIRSHSGNKKGGGKMKIWSRISKNCPCGVCVKKISLSINTTQRCPSKSHKRLSFLAARSPECWNKKSTNTVLEPRHPRTGGRQFMRANP